MQAIDLTLKEHRETTHRNNTHGGHFPQLNVGEYQLSIQGSDYAYSEPRVRLPHLSSYTLVEFAVFNENGWVNVEKVFPEHDDLWCRCGYDGMVGAYVSWDDIEEIYNILKGGK